MFFGIAKANDLTQGDLAPGFELLDQHGAKHRLEDYRGSWVVLYFYPKDDTPGCTREACAFRDDYLVLKRMGVTVLGVSLDDVSSHAEFAAKYHLPFPLLSDGAGETARRYGALTSLGIVKFAKRHSFIVDPEGRIARIYRDVAPRTHSDEIIGDLKSLGARIPD